MFRTARAAGLLAFLLCACGGKPPPPPDPPAPPVRTVFDDMVEKKKTLPAAVNAAQDEHMDATRRALDDPERAPAEGTPR
jgi:hypothetical protein